MADELTHLDEQGRARMVEVGGKPVTERSAVARGVVVMQPETLALLCAGAAPKGDVLAAARIAGIQGAKRTPELIPLCHAIAVSIAALTIYDMLKAKDRAMTIERIALYEKSGGKSGAFVRSSP